MKKALLLFLVLIMLLCLCACGKNDAQNAGSDIGSDHSTTGDNAEEPTISTDTKPDEDREEKPKPNTPNIGDKTESIAKPTTSTKDPTNVTSNATSNATSTDSSKISDTKPTTCNHSYMEVTCTTPKMCTKCNDIAANALPHNYKDGKCIVCGRAEMLVTFREGYWVADVVKDGTAEQGETLSEYILDPSFERYSGYVCFSNASACSVSNGKIVYNNKAYHSDWYYTAYISCTGKDEGDTIRIAVGTKDTVEFEFVLKKMSETQLTVISSTDTAYVPVGIVFVKK